MIDLINTGIRFSKSRADTTLKHYIIIINKHNKVIKL